MIPPLGAWYLGLATPIGVWNISNCSKGRENEPKMQIIFPKSISNRCFSNETKASGWWWLEHVLFFPSYWEWNHHPNCPTDSYFSEWLVKLVNHQPAKKNGLLPVRDGKISFYSVAKKSEVMKVEKPSWADKKCLCWYWLPRIFAVFGENGWLPFGKHTKNYGKAPIFWWVDHVDQLFRLGHFPSQTVDITRGCGIQWMEWGITRHHLLGWSAPVFRTPIRWFMKKLIDKQQHLKFRWIWWVCGPTRPVSKGKCCIQGKISDEILFAMFRNWVCVYSWKNQEQWDESHMLHGAGIFTYTFTLFFSPSYGAVNIPAPWVASVNIGYVSGHSLPPIWDGGPG